MSRFVLLAVVFVGLPILVLEYAGLTPLRRFALGVVFVLWAAFFFGTAVVRLRTGRKGALAFNVGFLLLALAVVEIFLGFTARRGARYTHRPAAETYVQKDELLGYGPVPGSVSRFRNVLGGELLFDVTYTIDEDGYRIQPPVQDPAPAESILCFGGSFTYGTGLRDDQTWPWKLQEDVGEAYRVRNLAFMAYGPHQMLAALEGERAQSVIRESPRHAIYLCIPDHARRVAGQAGYGRDEPRFVLQADGSVVREGLFGDEARHMWGTRIRQLTGHSNIVRTLRGRVRDDQYDVPRLAAIVAASQDRLHAAWPECAFHVVLWGNDHPVGKAVREALKAEELEVWLVEDLIDGLAENPRAFQIHATDTHPNARAAEALAAALAVKIEKADVEPIK